MLKEKEKVHLNSIQKLHKFYKYLLINRITYFIRTVCVFVKVNTDKQIISIKKLRMNKEITQDHRYNDRMCCNENRTSYCELFYPFTKLPLATIF